MEQDKWGLLRVSNTNWMETDVRICLPCPHHNSTIGSQTTVRTSKNRFKYHICPTVIETSTKASKTAQSTTRLFVFSLTAINTLSYYEPKVKQMKWYGELNRNSRHSITRQVRCNDHIRCKKCRTSQKQCLNLEKAKKSEERAETGKGLQHLPRTINCLTRSLCIYRTISEVNIIARQTMKQHSNM